MYTKELDEAVAAAREHREWRLEYMKMEAWEQDIRRESREEGEIINLAGQVYRKVLKGKSPEETAEELEEDMGRIKRIYDAVVKYLPEYDPEKILEELGCGEASADASNTRKNSMQVQNGIDIKTKFDSQRRVKG